MMFDSWELEEIKELDSTRERLNYIFSKNQRVEAFTSRSALEPRECIETQKHDRDEIHDIIEKRALAIELEPREAVFAHETRPDWAKSIMSEGFADPYEYHAEDSYHIPESERYGKVFVWPHVIEVGEHDRSGSVILCVGDIEEVRISAFSSFSALESREYYEKLQYTYEKILPSEYNECHIFDYEDYIEWLETNPEIEGRATLANLLPHNSNHRKN